LYCITTLALKSSIASLFFTTVPDIRRSFCPRLGLVLDEISEGDIDDKWQCPKMVEKPKARIPRMQEERIIIAVY
jgi:hypothetical protein